MSVMRKNAHMYCADVSEALNVWCAALRSRIGELGVDPTVSGSSVVAHTVVTANSNITSNGRGTAEHYKLLLGGCRNRRYREHEGPILQH